MEKSKKFYLEENVFEGVFKYIHKNRCNKNEWDIDENKYDTGGNISNTELENNLDKRYSSNSNLKTFLMIWKSQRIYWKVYQQIYQKIY